MEDLCSHSDPTGQLVFPVRLSSSVLARKAFWEFCTCPQIMANYSQMGFGLWMKNRTCPAAVHFSTSKLLNHLKNIQLHFNDTILAIALRETSRETRRMSQGRSRPRQDAATITHKARLTEVCTSRLVQTDLRVT